MFSFWNGSRQVITFKLITVLAFILQIPLDIYGELFLMTVRQKKMRCSVSFSEVVWVYRYVIATFFALCTLEFFRLGVMAYLEGVYNTLFAVVWVCGMFITMVTELIMANLATIVTMGATGVTVLKIIESLH